MVGCWLFNEGGGAKVWDISGNSKHGNFVNMNPSSAWVSSPRGSCIKFNGSTDYISFGDSFDMGSGSWSVSCWFKTTSSGFSLVEKSRANFGAGRWFLIYETGGLTAFLESSAGTHSATWTTTSILDNIWHHACAVWDRAANLTLYVDGVQRASTSISAGLADNYNTTYYMFFGAYGNTTDGQAADRLFLDGAMDIVSIYSRALTYGEIMQLYTSPYSSILLKNNRPPPILSSSAAKSNVINISRQSVDRASYW